MISARNTMTWKRAKKQKTKKYNNNNKDETNDWVNGGLILHEYNK